MAATATQLLERIDITSAARRVYDAECSLHAARQSRVDSWITAAADRLHDAIETHLAALAG